MMRITLAACVVALLSSSSARAQEPPHITLPSGADGITWNAVESADDVQSPTPRPVAIEYSDAYYTRAKIHKYASFATLPLFATELALGQSIYNDPNARTSPARNAHILVGTGITALFAVNTVTGVWNMWESRTDPSHHKLKLIHGILMLGADAGFVATFASGPGGKVTTNFDAQQQTHRSIALTSIGIASAGYLMMLFGNK
ncbi:MAG TPA: hypothetical protein VKI43_04850 [Vicinamibacterales bacterium]|nr:hypothetical protein [Vicinamibacterales bacterium]